MAVAALNPTQIHLLKMFSFSKSEQSLNNIKDALMHYFAKNVDDAMEQLWDEGKWDDQKNEAVLKEHLRTPYHGQ